MVWPENWSLRCTCYRCTLSCSCLTIVLINKQIDNLIQYKEMILKRGLTHSKFSGWEKLC